eukprot:Rhum_TRINITY_DN14369_c22_g1::Rhum_TRINITY_DN14369_c22_g1_i1::g.86843::m.86843
MTPVITRRCRSNSCPMWSEKETVQVKCFESSSVPGDLDDREAVTVVPFEKFEKFPELGGQFEKLDWAEVGEDEEVGTSASSAEAGDPAAQPSPDVEALMRELQALQHKNQQLDMTMTKLRSPVGPCAPQAFPLGHPHGPNHEHPYAAAAAAAARQRLNPMATPFHTTSDSSDYDNRFAHAQMNGYRPRRVGRFMSKRSSFSSSAGCTPESSFCGEPAFPPPYATDYYHPSPQEMWHHEHHPFPMH